MTAHTRWPRKFAATTARLKAEVAAMKSRTASPQAHGAPSSSRGMEGDIDRAPFPADPSPAVTAGRFVSDSRPVLSFPDDIAAVLLRPSYPGVVDLSGLFMRPVTGREEKPQINSTGNGKS